MKTTPFPRPDWHIFPKEGCVGVEARVCLVDRRSVLAMLRLGENSHTDVHSAPYDIHVLCMQGSGFASSGDQVTEIKAGESVLWPKGEPHNIFTKGTTMETVMLEYVGQIAE